MIKKPASAPRRGAKFMIEEWMVREYNLQGIELIIYALIHSFSRDGHSVYKGSIRYLSFWTGRTKSTIIKILANLMSSGLISRDEVHYTQLNQNRYYCEYWTVHSRTKSSQT